MVKKGQKWPFFGPGGSNFNPFFTIFCKSLINMPKNIILKNQKNSFTRKISKSKKLQKWPKKGQKWPFFGPPGPNFAKIKKKAWKFSYFYPREAVYQILENLAHQTWRKCVTNGRTDGRDWNHRSLRKNSGDQKLVFVNFGKKSQKALKYFS